VPLVYCMPAVAVMSLITSEPSLCQADLVDTHHLDWQHIFAPIYPLELSPYIWEIWQ
jgi:hypothetical protein